MDGTCHHPTTLPLALELPHKHRSGAPACAFEATEMFCPPQTLSKAGARFWAAQSGSMHSAPSVMFGGGRLPCASISAARFWEGFQKGLRDHVMSHATLGGLEFPAIRHLSMSRRSFSSYFFLLAGVSWPQWLFFLEGCIKHSTALDLTRAARVRGVRGS